MTPSRAVVRPAQEDGGLRASPPRPAPTLEGPPLPRSRAARARGAPSPRRDPPRPLPPLRLFPPPAASSSPPTPLSRRTPHARYAAAAAFRSSPDARLAFLPLVAFRSSPSLFSSASSSLVPDGDGAVPRGGLRGFPGEDHPGHAARARGADAAVQPGRGLPHLRRSIRLLQAVHGRERGRRGSPEPRFVRRRHQLVPRFAPRQEGGGERVLLHQRPGARDPRAPEAPPARRVHRHRHPPRRRRGGGVLSHRPRHGR